jgi:methylmalonyl-CoA/ethylmalonyl-CoA epimerase
MIERIDHVAIAVRDHDAALQFFQSILGAIAGKKFKASDRNFYWQTLALGDLSRLELISPAGPDSFLDTFLEKKEVGFHHITLQTPSLKETLKKLDDAQVPYFGKHEYPDGSWKEVFIHPRDAFGVLIQISEFDAAAWMVPAAQLPDGERFQVTIQDDQFQITAAHPGGGKVSLPCTRQELEQLAEDIQKALDA